ncbi:MAG: rod shape-determining protein MreC [Rhodothermales bacterium]|nr:rod shape-determining protein MreC [Rhodothermales bacterium]
MNRLWDRLRDWIILGVLLIVSILVLVSRNEPVVLGLRSVALQTASGIDRQISWLSSFAGALNENVRLREDNILLSSQVARSRETQLENARLRSLIQYRDSTSFDMRAGRIIAKDVTGQQNLMTINIGSNDSVDVGMSVVDERGIIGKVILTSPNYARVMPYLNTELRIPAKILPVQAAGIVRWGGTRKDELIMDHVIKTESVEIGQLVVASGYSAVFPEGLQIGTITRVERQEGRNELVIYLSPSTDATTASHVFVILEKPDPERIELENTPFN